MKINYGETNARVFALCAGEDDEIACMASIACELYHADRRFDWVGFYRNIGHETLKVGPYQGGHGCLTIPFSRGVCGAGARTGQVQLVNDVTAFEGHIACASSTQSEIVLPVFDSQGALRAVLDIDSNRPAAFDTADQAGLEALLMGVFG